MGPFLKRDNAVALGLTTYESGSVCVRGHAGLRYSVNHSCVECVSARAKRNHNYRVDRKNALHRMVIMARSRAKKNCLEFTITDTDVVIPEFCPCCKERIIQLKDRTEKLRGPQENSPSIDRKDNSIGYTPENSRIICHRCNLLKGDASIKDLENILTYMRSV